MSRHVDGASCNTAIIATEELHYAQCGEAMLVEPLCYGRSLMVISGQSQASYLRETYAPFSADTIRGTLVFSGTGTTTASKAEQRAIAEWSYSRFDLVPQYESEGSRYGPSLSFSDRLGNLKGELAAAEEIDRMLRFAREVYAGLTDGDR